MNVETTPPVTARFRGHPDDPFVAHMAVQAALVLLVLAGNCFAQSAERSAKPVTVHLMDGSRIVGSTANELIRVRNEFAELKIPLARIRRMTWLTDRENVKVEFRNGDVFTAGIIPEPLKLQTLFGDLTVKMEVVRQLDVHREARRATVPVEEGLVLYLPMDNPLAVSDNSGDPSGGFAEIHGAKYVEDGRVNGAFRFATGSERMTVKAPHGFEFQKLTICAWVKPEQRESASYRGIIMRTSSGSWGDGFGLAQYTGELTISFFINGYGRSEPSTKLTNNTWTHLAGTYDGKELRYYANAKLAGKLLRGSSGNQDPFGGESPPGAEDPFGKAQKGTSPVRYRPGDLVIGNAPSGSYPWSGLIDEVLVYNRALEAREIQAIVEAAGPPPRDR